MIACALNRFFFLQNNNNNNSSSSNKRRTKNTHRAKVKEWTVCKYVI